MTYGLIVKSDVGLDQITTDFPQMYVWAEGGVTVGAVASFDPATWTQVTFPAIPVAHSQGAMLFVRNANASCFAMTRRFIDDQFRISVRNATGGALSRYVEWKVCARASAFFGTPLPAYGMVTYNPSGLIMSRSDMAAWQHLAPVNFTKAEILGASPVFKSFGVSGPFLNAGVTSMRLRQTSSGSTATHRHTGVQTSGSSGTVFAMSFSAQKVFEDYDVPFTSVALVKA